MILIDEERETERKVLIDRVHIRRKKTKQSLVDIHKQQRAAWPA
jgi:hypothetical protein